jgi:predicted LPLAT superfamily acyltransferase
MNRHWMDQKERGSAMLMRLIMRITLGLGRPVGRVLLYPITLYYVIFSGKARRASRGFLERVLQRPVRWRDVFHHYHTFAATILDRVYLLAGRLDYFHVDIRDGQIFFDQLTKGRGCLLLGSHLGSFEVLRSLAQQRPDIRVRPMMYTANSDRVNQVLNALNPTVATEVIAIGEPDSLIQVKETLAAGDVVGILGDRRALDDKSIDCQFLGRPCRFPRGPLLIAGLMQTPVVLFFGLYCGGRRYRVHFELLTVGFLLHTDHREREIAKWTQRYVDRLEHYCRLAPFNWFNFYDFWDENDGVAGL